MCITETKKRCSLFSPVHLEAELLSEVFQSSEVKNKNKATKKEKEKRTVMLGQHNEDMLLATCKQSITQSVLRIDHVNDKRHDVLNTAKTERARSLEFQYNINRIVRDTT